MFPKRLKGTSEIKNGKLNGSKHQNLRIEDKERDDGRRESRSEK